MSGQPRDAHDKRLCECKLCNKTESTQADVSRRHDEHAQGVVEQAEPELSAKEIVYRRRIIL